MLLPCKSSAKKSVLLFVNAAAWLSPAHFCLLKYCPLLAFYLIEGDRICLPVPCSTDVVSLPEGVRLGARHCFQGVTKADPRELPCGHFPF